MGKFAIVDDEDYEFLMQWKWTAQKTSIGFYAVRWAKPKNIIMHRLINGTPDGLVTDHIDGDGLNNQRNNLRSVTQLQNTWNRRGKRGGTSKFKGVWFDAGNQNLKKWRAAIRINGRLKYLGRFHTEEEAGAAYAFASHAYFGEFARTTPGEKK